MTVSSGVQAAEGVSWRPLLTINEFTPSAYGSSLQGLSELKKVMPDQKVEVIVQGSDVATDAFAAVINAKPTTVLVKKVASDVVVLLAPQSDLDELRSRFPGLIIEPNEELRF